MRSLLLLIALACLTRPIFAQYVYTLKADTVKITNCDSAELVLQNHTQGVPGFLFNAGNGRTVFQRGAQSIGNGIYLIGADTIRTAANAWVQGGNAFGTTGILGTTDNNHLDFYTNNTWRARLDSLGSFTLGNANTTNSNILAVNGLSSFANNVNMANGTTLSVGAIYVVDDFDGRYISCVNNEPLSITSGVGGYTTYNGNVILGGATGSSIILQPGGQPNAAITVTAQNSAYPSTTFFSFGNLRNDGVKQAIINTVDFNAQAQGGTTAIDLYLYPGKETYSNSQGNTVIAYDGTNQRGNVGIGTPTPTAQLHTTGSVRFAGLTQDSTQTQVLVSDANGNLYYRSASSLAATDVIRSSFAVNGPISAQRLTLSRPDWADYVFDSTYNLLSLTETEDYIHRQHHLPGIPSALEVEKKGIEVGETQVALLKKIEELTLYAIGQEKKLDEQQKSLDAQAIEIQTLKSEMEVLTKLIRNNSEK